MTEFTHGIQGAIKKLLTGSSFGLAIVYTLGHIVIAMAVVSTLTGASLWEAGLVALVEPSINGVWFFVLHLFIHWLFFYLLCGSLLGLLLCFYLGLRNGI